LIGVPSGLPEWAPEAEADGADYIGAEPVYPTQSKATRPPEGSELIKRVKQVTSLPIVGIAGIGPGKAAPVIEAGADGVAVISAVLDAPDPVGVAKRLLEEVARAKRERSTALAEG